MYIVHNTIVHSNPQSNCVTCYLQCAFPRKQAKFPLKNMHCVSFGISKRVLSLFLGSMALHIWPISFQFELMITTIYICKLNFKLVTLIIPYFLLINHDIQAGSWSEKNHKTRLIKQNIYKIHEYQIFHWKRLIIWVLFHDKRFT